MLADSQGLETFLTIKRHAPWIPVIILTGIDDEKMALAGVQQGAQDYLVKDKLTKDTLVRAVGLRDRAQPEAGGARGARAGEGGGRSGCSVPMEAWAPPR